MKRAVDIGPLDAAAIKTGSGKVRLRLLFTVDQLEALLRAARDDDDDMKRSVTQCNAPDESQTREEVDDEDDARARPPPQPPKVVDRADYVFVIEGTPAWIAWLDHRARNRQPRSLPTTSRQDEGGHWKRGWWLPTLFPPPPTDPPKDNLLESDAQHLAK